jgi:O-antigen/teichoic acid export membrane protein
VQLWKNCNASNLRKSILAIGPVRRKEAALVRFIASWVDQAALIVTGIFLLPLYLNILGIKMYGLWLSSGGIIAWISMITISPIVSQRVAFHYGNKDLTLATSYYWSSYIVNLLTSLIVVVLSWVLSTHLVNFFEVPLESAQELRGAFLIAVAALLIQLMTGSAGAFINSIQRPLIILWMRPFAAIAHVLTTYLLLVSGYGLYCIPLGLVVRNLLIGLWACAFASYYALKINRSLIIKYDTICDILVNSPATVFGYLGRGAAGRLQYTLLGGFLGPEIVAIYDAATKLMQFIQTIISRFIGAILPSFAHLYGTQETTRINTIFQRVFLLVFCGAAAGIIFYGIFNNSLVAIWIGPEMLVSFEITLCVGIACFWVLIAEFLSGVLVQVGKISYASSLAGIFSILQLVLVISLIQKLGLLALPVSQLLSSIIAAILLLYSLRDFVKTGIPDKPINLLAGPLILLLTISGTYVGCQTQLSMLQLASIILAVAVTFLLCFSFARKYFLKLLIT